MLFRVLTSAAMLSISSGCEMSSENSHGENTSKGVERAEKAPADVKVAPPIRKAKKSAEPEGSAQAVDTCVGNWVYLPKDLEKEVGFSVNVLPEFKYRIQFSDFGKSSGNYIQIGSLDTILRLTDVEHGDTYDMGECESSAEITFDDGREFTLKKSPGDIFDEAAQRGTPITDE